MRTKEFKDASIRTAIRKTLFQGYSKLFKTIHFVNRRKSALIALALAYANILPLALFVDSQIPDSETRLQIYALRIVYLLSFTVPLLLGRISSYIQKLEPHPYIILATSTSLLSLFFGASLHTTEIRYYMLGGALTILAFSLIIWVEPRKLLFLLFLNVTLMYPLFLRISHKNNRPEMEILQDSILLFSISAISFIGNSLINFWRMQDYRNFIKISKTLGKLEIQNEKIRTMSLLDPLTELYNRRHLLDQYESMKSRSKRENSSFAVIIMDLDYLKRYNDTYGHKQGDLVIQEFANILRARVRNTDIAARIGGDEFCIIAQPIDANGLKILT